MRNIRKLFSLTLWASFLLLSTTAGEFDPRHCQLTKYQAKPRVFVSTDIGNEPDDQMSFVRFLTYSNEFTVEGIAATTSGSLNATNLPIIQSVLTGYAAVVDNLNANVPAEGRFPNHTYLSSILST